MQGIASVQNAYVKHLVKLREKSRFRKSTEQFLVEGLREVNAAIDAGYVLQRLLWVSSYFEKTAHPLPKVVPSLLWEITPIVYQKIALREGTEGILGVFKEKTSALADLDFSVKPPLFLVAAAIEKPGNMGALLRTADALGVDAVFMADAKTDPYNPNLIRNSLGAIFTLPVLSLPSRDLISFLQEKEVAIYSAALHRDAMPYTDCDFTKPTAIVVGAEATGLSDIWLNTKGIQKIIIPMSGVIDSMNVSVAAAVLLAEAKRQRIY